MRRILTELRQHKLAVIATNSADGPPESALVAFCADAAGCIYFQTKGGTRKAINLATDPRVSFVIGQAMTTIQYEGRATMLCDPAQIASARQRFLCWDSPTRPEHFKPDTRLYRVAPTWIGYSDYTKVPPDVWEWRPGKKRE